MRIWMLLGLILLLPGPLSGPAMGQTAPPAAPPAVDPNADPNSEFHKTQAFISKTQSKIARVRRETEARAREIEALATRVGDIISAMSSQGEDNTNLISEISVLNELLTIERQTTTGLRGDIDGMNKTLNAREAEHRAAEAALTKRLDTNEAAHRAAEAALKIQHEEDMEAAAGREARLARDIVRAQDITAAAQRNLSASEQKLDSAHELMAGRAKTNRLLVSDIKTMRKEIRRLHSEIQLIKRRRTTPLPHRPTPNILRPTGPGSNAQ